MIRWALAEIRRPLDVDRRAPQPVDLVGQHARVDDDAVADHAELAGVEDARRDQVELERLAVADDRVAGVVAALEAHDDVGPLGEQVDDLALALVAPLGADDHDAWHGPQSVGSRELGLLRGAGTSRGVVPEERDAARTSPRGARRCARRSARRAPRARDVRRDDHRALLLVAGVDDRVELLEHPRARLLGAEVVDVQQVDARPGGPAARGRSCPSVVVVGRADLGEQARQRVDRHRAPGARGRPWRRASPASSCRCRRRPRTTARARVEVLVDRAGEAADRAHAPVASMSETGGRSKDDAVAPAG